MVGPVSSRPPMTSADSHISAARFSALRIRPGHRELPQDLGLPVTAALMQHLVPQNSVLRNELPPPPPPPLRPQLRSELPCPTHHGLSHIFLSIGLLHVPAVCTSIIYILFLEFEPGIARIGPISHPIGANALLPDIALRRPISGRFTIYNFIAYIAIKCKIRNSGAGFRIILQDIGAIYSSGFQVPRRHGIGRFFNILQKPCPLFSLMSLKPSPSRLSFPRDTPVQVYRQSTTYSPGITRDERRASCSVRPWHRPVVRGCQGAVQPRRSHQC